MAKPKDSTLLQSAPETRNGLCLNNEYVPNVVCHILTFIEPKELLKCSLVCRNWNKCIKSYALWSTLYKRKYQVEPKRLPWYLFYGLFCTNYFDNLLKNGNGEENFNHWFLVRYNPDDWKIESVPVGTDPLPLNVAEFNNQTSCFAASDVCTCSKLQIITLNIEHSLLRYILNIYKPHIYLSEWTATRSGCSDVYKLWCDIVTFIPEDVLGRPNAVRWLDDPEGSHWEKVELTITEYPRYVQKLIFGHTAIQLDDEETSHCGVKTAGGVVKLLFDSIEPLQTDEQGREIAKEFSEIKFEVNNGEKELFEY